MPIIKEHKFLLTDDGSPTTSILAQSLFELGYQVSVLCFPESTLPLPTPLPAKIDRFILQDWSEQHLQEQLAKIGAVNTFIHLHPHTEEFYSETEAAIVQQVFMLAKHLKTSLNQATEGRNAFLTVTRLDGELGLGNKRDFGAIGGGLFGLTKSLNHEWEAVFCRAIDLSPDMDGVTTSRHILDELQDPNLLITEVGYGDKGRVTLVGM